MALPWLQVLKYSPWDLSLISSACQPPYYWKGYYNTEPMWKKSGSDLDIYQPPRSTTTFGTTLLSEKKKKKAHKLKRLETESTGPYKRSFKVKSGWQYGETGSAGAPPVPVLQGKLQSLGPSPSFTTTKFRQTFLKKTISEKVKLTSSK